MFNNEPSPKDKIFNLIIKKICQNCNNLGVILKDSIKIIPFNSVSKIKKNTFKKSK